MALTFFYNGIKGADKKLQPCHYSDSELRSYPPETITIYNREYTRFSLDVREAFTVLNETDMMTDYFEKDRIYVTPDHPLYPHVREAFQKQQAHRTKRAERYTRR